MKLTRTPIASAVALALVGVVTSAQAQTPPAKDLSTVTVTGIRASLEQSLNQKRNADTLVEVITAEDIGKMPDKNVADSLQRVPGVTISSASATEGGFDENDRVSLRGTNPSLTQTLVDGHSMSSGDWFVLNQTGQVGRSVSYSLLPSELVGKVVVHKGTEASLVEGGVAGAVNIITRKPLEFKKALTGEVSLGAVHATLPNTTDPQASALINWKTDTVGVLVQAFSEKRHLRRDGQEVLGYDRIAAGSAIATSHPDLAGVYYPSLLGSVLFEQERKRTGGLISVQIKPSNDFDLTATAFTSKMDAANYNRNYMLWGAKILNGGAGQAPNAGYVVRNGTLVSATFAAVPGTQYGVYDQISRPDSSSDSKFLNVEAKWNVSDRLTLKGKLGSTEGNGNTPTQDVAEWNTGVGTGAGWQFNGIGAANWNLGTQNNASPAGLALGWIFGDQKVNTKDKENWSQLDGEYALDGMFNTLKFGVRATDHTRASGGVIGQGPGCITSTGASVGFDWSQQYWCPVGTKSAADPANFPVGFQNYPSNFGSGLGGNVPNNIWYYSPAQLNAYNKLSNRSTDGSREDWASEFALAEKTQAGYVQGDFSAGNYNGNVGVRFVRTQQSVTNNVAVDAATPGAITASAFGPFKPITTDHEYTDVMPSVNLNFKLSRDMVARLGYARNIARPDYSALAGTVSLSPPAVAGGVGSGSGGNPDLEPVRSNNFNATFEYYFAPRSLVSAGLFYMDLESYIGFGQVRKKFMTYSQAAPQGVLTDYQLTVPMNTRGEVSGLELAWEQPLFGNFGFSANVTFTEAKDSNGGPLVGASKQVANLVAYYEDEKFNARIAYNTRSSFYSGLDRNTAFSQASTATLAASVGYTFSKNFAVTLDAQNLNEPLLKYYALNEDQPRSTYHNGRQYYLNARIKF